MKQVNYNLIDLARAESIPADGILVKKSGVKMWVKDVQHMYRAARTEGPWLVMVNNIVEWV
jgi:hypothetical protein